MEAALGMMNEEMMAQWRKSLEQSIQSRPPASYKVFRFSLSFKVLGKTHFSATPRSRNNASSSASSTFQKKSCQNLCDNLFRFPTRKNANLQPSMQPSTNMLYIFHLCTYLHSYSASAQSCCVFCDNICKIMRPYCGIIGYCSRRSRGTINYIKVTQMYYIRAVRVEEPQHNSSQQQLPHQIETFTRLIHCFCVLSEGCVYLSSHSPSFPTLSLL